MDYRRKKKIKKRIEKRKLNRNKKRQIKNGMETYFPYTEYESPEQIPWVSLERMGKKGHPLFQKDVFLIKIFLSACLVFAVALLYKTPTSTLEPMKKVVERVMEKDFQFAKMVSWYEDTFGHPLALFPDDDRERRNPSSEFALPANGIISETFHSDHQGVTFQTEKNVQVTAVQEGIVIFAGIKEDTGKTVVIQHPDTTETWYGKLGDISVRTYDSIQAGDPIGIVSSSKTKDAGEFYFAVKKDDAFVDPVQVINIE